MTLPHGWADTRQPSQVTAHLPASHPLNTVFDTTGSGDTFFSFKRSLSTLYISFQLFSVHDASSVISVKSYCSSNNQFIFNLAQWPSTPDTIFFIQSQSLLNRTQVHKPKFQTHNSL